MESSTLKRIGLVFSILCGVGLFTCLLVDLLIAGTVTWAAYTSLFIAFGWLVGMAALRSRKHVARNGLTAISALTLPFLFLLDITTPGQGWFWPVALPIGAASIAFLWLSIYMINKVRRLWAILAIIALQYGVLLNALIQLVLSRHRQTPFLTLSLGIDLFSSVLLMIVFAVLDVRKRRDQKTMAV